MSSAHKGDVYFQGEFCIGLCEVDPEIAFSNTAGQGSTLGHRSIPVHIHASKHVLLIHVFPWTNLLNRSPKSSCTRGYRQSHLGSHPLVQRFLGNHGIRTESIRWVKWIFIVEKYLITGSFVSLGWGLEDCFCNCFVWGLHCWWAVFKNMLMPFCKAASTQGPFALK